MTEQSQPNGVRKVRMSVPDKDETVSRWLDEQESLSISFRLLVRGEVAREGYGDMLTRPVVPGGDAR